MLENILVLVLCPGRAIRHRACALRDTAQSIISAELDEEFEKQCVEIKEARKRRGKLINFGLWLLMTCLSLTLLMMVLTREHGQ